ncbi:MAG TPA: hypothetical protein VG102_03020 [Candidatus Paceibacterota bacterium]|jgi:hypothetical protein|nr:hypothetical protein [Candidatus Paceibacterota bacterium]
MHFLARVFLKWLPLGVAVTLLCGLICATVQQNYRQSANDPQIQMAEDAAVQLSAGAKPGGVVQTPDAVDITNSLAPWLAIYNNDGVAIISSGVADGAIPVLPQGVFDMSTWKKQYAEDRIPMQLPPNETRFTWQSGAGVRQALVMVHYDSPSGSGYVVAGRNISEIENRVQTLTVMVGIGWLVTMTATYIAQALAAYLL